MEKKITYDLKNKEHVQKIVKGCLANDSKIQKIFFEMTYRRMMGIIIKYTHDYDSAQDVLNDSWIKIFKNIGKYEYSGSFEGWFSKIAVNTAVDSLRRGKNTYVMDSDDMSYFDGMITEDEEFEIENEEIEGLSSEELIKEIQNLSPCYRVSFNLFVFEGMNHEEISLILGISVGTSKSNLSKAKRVLRKRISNLVYKKKSKQKKIIEDYRLHDIKM